MAEASPWCEMSRGCWDLSFGRAKRRARLEVEMETSGGYSFNSDET